jgi:hypothetical protein
MPLPVSVSCEHGDDDVAVLEDEVFIGHGVAPQSPRFDAPINALAMHIQTHAEPGYGGNMLWVCDKRAAAADSLTPRQRIQTVKR